MKTFLPGFDSPIGGTMVYWQRNQKPVQDFITQNGLSAIRLPDLGIHGGIRTWHVHLGDQVYPLTSAQWSKFSKGITDRVSSKLQSAPQVTFEEGMLLAVIAQGIEER